MGESFDLFGDPVPEGRGLPGRPRHVATQQNRNKVSMLLALGWSNERIAAGLAISPPTLRRNYFRELKSREVARDRLDAARVMQIWTQAEAGNVGAMRELGKFIERNDLMLYGQTQKPVVEPAPKEPRLGKKEQALVAASHPDTGSLLGSLIAQRQTQSH